MDGKYLSDAAHYPGGHAAAIAVPRSAAEIPAIVRDARTLLAIGAQSSLTGGATPMGELVLSTEKLTRVLDAGPSHIRVEAGVPVTAIQEALARARRLVSAGADLHRRARRRHRRHQRRGRGDVPARAGAPVGRGTDGGPRRRIRAGGPPRRARARAAIASQSRPRAATSTSRSRPTACPTSSSGRPATTRSRTWT